MSNRQHTTGGPPATLGDSAVDGLLAGGGAGIGMAAYLFVAGLLSGEAPGAVFARFDASQSGSPVVGALTHLAVAGIYGLLFGLAFHFLPPGWRARWPGWLAGLLYGAALWAVAVLILLPGSASALREIPPVHFAVAHAVYGLTLGYFAGQPARQSAAPQKGGSPRVR